MGLRAYVIRRIGQLIITFWAFVTILFFMFRIMPGDPTSMFVLQGLSEEGRQQLINELGLNEPLHVQYYKYVTGLLTGDMGMSFTYREPVWNILVVKFWNTVLLMGPTLMLAIFFGTVFGALLGWFRDTTFEKAGIVVTVMARSSPQFWTGILVLMIFVFWLGWFPAGEIRDVGSEWSGFFGKYLAWDFVYHAFLPLLTGWSTSRPCHSC
jgi:peptide/nickel transport system permease protein